MIAIQVMQTQHAAAVLQIYREGIETGLATFETKVPVWEKFDQKYLPHSRLIAVEGEIIVGWATLSPVSTRECYKGVAEVSVYVRSASRGSGFGKKLLQALISESEKNNTWSLLSIIDEQNKVSIRLHEGCGFRTIGYRERIAQLEGKWKTTLMMERRSKIIGV